MAEKELPVGFEKAIKRLFFAALCSSGFFVVFYWVFPPEFNAHWIGTGYAFGTLLLLRVLLSVLPRSKLHWIIAGIKFGFVTSFIPVSWYFVIEAWRERWTLVESFPPILPLMVVASSMILLLMSANRLPYFISANWFLIAFPVLAYLFAHPDEMRSARGLDLLFAFGPTSLFFILIIPYQMAFAQKYHRMAGVLKAAKEESERDFLTDLYNARGLKNRLRTLNSSTNALVLTVGVSNLKYLNSAFGHDVGDRVLVEFAARLRIVYQDTHFLARWQGDEFLVVLIEPDEDDIEHSVDDFHSWLGAAGYPDIDGESVDIAIGVSELSSLSRFSEMQSQSESMFAKAKVTGLPSIYHHAERSLEFDF